MELHKDLVNNTLKAIREDEELAHFSDEDLLKMIDGFFRAAHIFHDEKENVKFPYLFTSVFDDEKPIRKATVLKMANEEADKIIKAKGSISKKEMVEEIKKAGYKFRHIKPIN